MTFLDAYALVALLGDEPAADEVEALLREGGARVVVVNLAEAVDIVLRVHNIPSSVARGALDPLLLTDVVVPVASDESHGWLAAEIRGRHYSRKAAPLSMADCFLLAHASRANDSIATSDPPLAKAAASLDIEVVGLPDSSGRRP